MNAQDFEKQRLRFMECFTQCQPALSAIGDQTRQSILFTLIRNGGKGGLRVGEIQAESNVSRTAVSHHLRVLMEASIILVRHDGTKNYYSLDPQSSSLRELVRLWEQVEPLMQLCKQQRGE